MTIDHLSNGLAIVAGLVGGAVMVCLITLVEILGCLQAIRKLLEKKP